MSAQKITILMVLVTLMIFMPSPGNHSSSQDHGLIAGYSSTYSVTSHTIYMDGNLTVNQENRSILSGYTLKFCGNFTHYLIVEGNVTVRSEQIESGSGRIIMENGKGDSHLTLCDSSFTFHGTLDLSNATVIIRNTSITGGHVRVIFSDDSVTMNDSFIDSTSSVRYNGQMYPVAIIEKNGQPAGGYLPVKFTFTKLKYESFPANVLIINVNYTSNTPEELYFSMNPGQGIHIRENVSISPKDTNATFKVRLAYPIYTAILNASCSFQGYINASSQDNVTIWNADISLLSTSELNYSGISHNYIEMIHTRMLIVNSSVNGSSGNFICNGLLNQNKTGIFETEKSSLTMISSYFSSWHGKLEMDNAPVITQNESRLKFFKALLVYGHMHNITSSIPLLKSNIYGYGRTELNLPEKYLPYVENSSTSAYVMALEINNSGHIYNFANFTIGGISYFVSWSLSSIMRDSGITENISMNFTSEILSQLKLSYNDKEISIETTWDDLYNNSRNITSQITVTYSGHLLQKRYFWKDQDPRDDFSRNITLGRMPSFRKNLVNVSLAVEYFNGVINTSDRVSRSVCVNSLYYRYIFHERGLPPSTIWQVLANGSNYTSTGAYIEFNSLSNKSMVEVLNTTLYHPVNASSCYDSGNNTIIFQRSYGVLKVQINSPSNGYTVEYDNITGHYNTSDLTLTLPYGRNTIIVSNRYSSKTVIVCIKNNNQDLNVSLSGNAIDMNTIISGSVAGAILAILMYFSSRRLFYSFCPYCMEIIRPFSIGKHRCEYRKGKEKSGL